MRIGAPISESVSRTLLTIVLGTPVLTLLWHICSGFAFIETAAKELLGEPTFFGAGNCTAYDDMAAAIFANLFYEQI